MTTASPPTDYNPMPSYLSLSNPNNLDTAQLAIKRDTHRNLNLKLRALANGGAVHLDIPLNIHVDACSPYFATTNSIATPATSIEISQASTGTPDFEYNFDRTATSLDSGKVNSNQ